MKRLILRVLFWVWIASIMAGMVAIYWASWMWTIILFGYAVVWLAAVGFLKATSDTRMFAAPNSTRDETVTDEAHRG